MWAAIAAGWLCNWGSHPSLTACPLLIVIMDLGGDALEQSRSLKLDTVDGNWQLFLDYGWKLAPTDAEAVDLQPGVICVSFLLGICSIHALHLLQLCVLLANASRVPSQVTGSLPVARVGKEV